MVQELLHGTAVALDGKAALIVGPSGAGKSDLALRFLSSSQALYDAQFEQRLVGDDQLYASVTERGGVVLRPPDNLAGLIEVRGVGIVRVPHIPCAELSVVVTLVSGDEVNRLPEMPSPHTNILSVSVPSISLWAFEPSAPQKLYLALVSAAGLRGQILTDL